MNPETALLQFVATCRRRVRLVLLVQYLPVAFAAACLISALIAIGGIDRAATWNVVVAVAAIGLTAVAAWLRTPSATRIAAEIDRRLDLKDSVVAAIQLRGSAMAVAPLIVRDAAASVGGAMPSSVFRFEFRRRDAMAAVGAVLLLLVVLTARNQTDPRPASQTSPMSAGGMQTATGNPPARPGQTAERSSTGRPVTSEGQTPVAIANPNRVSGTPNEQPRLAQTNAANTESPANRGGSAAGQGRARAAADGAVSAGAGAASVGGGAGAGGVRGQDVLNSTAPTTNSVAAGRPSTGEYARARQRATAALLRDQIPPDLRAYVRDYFVAIAPEPGGK